MKPLQPHDMIEIISWSYRVAQNKFMDITEIPQNHDLNENDCLGFVWGNGVL